MDAIGVPLNFSNIANDLMPKLLTGTDQLEPARIVSE